MTTADTQSHQPTLTADAICALIADAAEYQRQRQDEPRAFESYLYAAMLAYAPAAMLAMDSMREAGLMPQQGHA